MRLSRARTAGARAYASAPLPAPATPWREAEWCVVDLELSGLDPRRHEIVSFGAVPVLDGRAALAQSVSGLVRPAGEISPDSIRIHGLRAGDLASAPPLQEALEPLFGAMAGRGLVAHVARVERAFLGRAFARLGTRLRGPVVDTAVIGRLWLSEREGRLGPEPRLDDLAGAMGVPVQAQHDALGDALTTAQVFIAAATHLSALAPETVRSLSRAERRLRTIATYGTAEGG